jgi:hypothetical protein
MPRRRKDPSGRFQTVGEFAAALAPFGPRTAADTVNEILELLAAPPDSSPPMSAPPYSLTPIPPSHPAKETEPIPFSNRKDLRMNRGYRDIRFNPEGTLLKALHYRSRRTHKIAVLAGSAPAHQHRAAASSTSKR